MSDLQKTYTCFIRSYSSRSLTSSDSNCARFRLCYNGMSRKEYHPTFNTEFRREEIFRFNIRSSLRRRQLKLVVLDYSLEIALPCEYIGLNVVFYIIQEGAKHSLRNFALPILSLCICLRLFPYKLVICLFKQDRIGHVQICHTIVPYEL